MATANIKASIEGANKNWMTAFKNADAATIAGLYTAQAQLLPANTTLSKVPTPFATFGNP